MTGAVLLLFGLMIFVGWEQRQLGQVRAEREVLQRQLAGLRGQLHPQTSHPAAILGSEESESARKEHLELLRLRNEVGQLRQQQQELEKGRLENAQLRVALRIFETGNPGLTLSFAPGTTAKPNAWIGANIMLLPDTANPGVERVVIGGIAKNSPAAEAGLEEGDVVISADGQTLTNMWQLIGAVTNGLPGQPLLLDVVRNDTPQQIIVTRGAPP